MALRMSQQPPQQQQQQSASGQDFLSDVLRSLPGWLFVLPSHWFIHTFYQVWIQMTKGSAMCYSLSRKTTRRMKRKTRKSELVPAIDVNWIPKQTNKITRPPKSHDFKSVERCVTLFWVVVAGTSYKTRLFWIDQALSIHTTCLWWLWGFQPPHNEDLISDRINEKSWKPRCFLDTKNFIFPLFSS